MRKTAFALMRCFGLMTAGLIISEHTNAGLLRTNARLLELNAQLVLRESQLEAVDAGLRRSCDGLKAAADVLYDSNLRLRAACTRELQEWPHHTNDLGCATDKGCR